MTSNKTFITIIFLAAALAGFTFAMSGVPVLAQAKDSPNASQRAGLKKKINAKLGNLKQFQHKKSRDYQKKIDNFDKQIKRLEDKGYDTTNLRTSLETLKSKVALA